MSYKMEFFFRLSPIVGSQKVCMTNISWHRWPQLAAQLLQFLQSTKFEAYLLFSVTHLDLCLAKLNKFANKLCSNVPGGGDWCITQS